MNRFLLVIAMLVAACAGPDTTPTTPDPTDSVPVVRVLDGDSLVVDLDGVETEVRLLGINAPERDECYDAEAKARARELAGSEIILDGDDRDRFGRLLSYAFQINGDLINEKLVTEGLALALSTDHPRVSEFKRAEAAAWESRVGRWQPEACGPAAEGTISILRLEPDAPGNDSTNPNGEFVEIGNEGETPIDLAGWVLQDESSSHRFTFPTGVTLGPGDRVTVFSGCGEASSQRFYFCDGDPVWSNRGDTAYLLDSAGNVAARHAF